MTGRSAVDGREIFYFLGLCGLIMWALITKKIKRIAVRVVASGSNIINIFFLMCTIIRWVAHSEGSRTYVLITETRNLNPPFLSTIP